jgi:hypothetical protein
MPLGAQPRREAISRAKSAKYREAAPPSLIRRFCPATLESDSTVRFLSEGMLVFPEGLIESYADLTAVAAG